MVIRTLLDGFHNNNTVRQYLKGVGIRPKSGKKKGGMKVHTVMKNNIGVPMGVQLTSAAKHDHYLLNEVHLPKDSTLATDRAYVDYVQFQRFTDEGVCYVTKMKKNLRYRTLSSVTHMSPDGLAVYRDERILFEKGELRDESRMVTFWEKKKKTVQLLTNNFEILLRRLRECDTGTDVCRTDCKSYLYGHAEYD